MDFYSCPQVMEVDDDEDAGEAKPGESHTVEVGGRRTHAIGSDLLLSHEDLPHERPESRQRKS